MSILSENKKLTQLKKRIKSTKKKERKQTLFYKKFCFSKLHIINVTKCDFDACFGPTLSVQHLSFHATLFLVFKLFFVY